LLSIKVSESSSKTQHGYCFFTQWLLHSKYSCSNEFLCFQYGAFRSALSSARTKRSNVKEQARRQFLMALATWMKRQKYARLAELAAKRLDDYTFQVPPHLPSERNYFFHSITLSFVNSS
jgi:hypothetical protein